jgi:hypothetical protein
MFSVFCEHSCKVLYISDKADGESAVIVHQTEGKEHQDRHLHLRLQVRRLEVLRRQSHKI